jgi:hypothetical protein
MRKEKLLMLYKNLKINGGKEEIILKLEGCWRKGGWVYNVMDYKVIETGRYWEEHGSKDLFCVHKKRKNGTIFWNELKDRGEQVWNVASETRIEEVVQLAYSLFTYNGLYKERQEIFLQNKRLNECNTLEQLHKIKIWIHINSAISKYKLWIWKEEEYKS